MSAKTKVVDGVVVTNTDVYPPVDWTNDYEEMGGDMRWKDEIEEVVKKQGLDGDVQPFFGGTCHSTGEDFFLLRVGEDYIFWNAIGEYMYRVNGNLTLKQIVAGVNEGGVISLDTEEL